MDDTIITSPNKDLIKEILEALQRPSEEGADDAFDIEDEGDIDDFLGVKLRLGGNGTLHFTQPHLIQSIIRDLGLTDETHALTIPANPDGPLSPGLDELTHQGFHYASVIGKLNYLEKSSRPDLSVAVHQCARYNHDPKTNHTRALKKIGRYLCGTREQGVTYNCDSTRGLECWVDASFAGDWDKEMAMDDPRTARSRTGFCISYAGCPIVWTSKVQTEIALSTTEAEYIALSTAMRDVIPIMELIEEATKYGIPMNTVKPEVRCKIFEDNSGVVEMVQVPKMRPRTKHLNIKYHHFRELVREGKVTIHQVPTDEQLADMMTKPLSRQPFERFRLGICGW